MMFNKINAKRFRAGPKRYYEQGVLDIELVAYIGIPNIMQKNVEVTRVALFPRD